MPPKRTVLLDLVRPTGGRLRPKSRCWMVTRTDVLTVYLLRPMFLAAFCSFYLSLFYYAVNGLVFHAVPVILDFRCIACKCVCEGASSPTAMAAGVPTPRRLSSDLNRSASIPTAKSDKAPPKPETTRRGTSIPSVDIVQSLEALYINTFTSIDTTPGIESLRSRQRRALHKDVSWLPAFDQPPWILDHQQASLDEQGFGKKISAFNSAASAKALHLRQSACVGGGELQRTGFFIGRFGSMLMDMSQICVREENHGDGRAITRFFVKERYTYSQKECLQRLRQVSMLAQAWFEHLEENYDTHLNASNIFQLHDDVFQQQIGILNEAVATAVELKWGDRGQGEERERAAGRMLSKKWKSDVEFEISERVDLHEMHKYLFSGIHAMHEAERADRKAAKSSLKELQTFLDDLDPDEYDSDSERPKNFRQTTGWSRMPSLFPKLLAQLKDAESKFDLRHSYQELLIDDEVGEKCNYHTEHMQRWHDWYACQKRSWGGWKCGEQPEGYRLMRLSWEEYSACETSIWRRGVADLKLGWVIDAGKSKPV